MGGLSSWEEDYRSVKSLWGLEPDHVLAKYSRLIPRGNVLDLGIGEGRNALFFAKMGYEVEGVDISSTAIERCAERAKNANLRIKLDVKDLRETDIPEGRYSLIIAAWVLNFFKRIEIEEIVKDVKNGLKGGGFFYTGVLSVEDPGYESAKKDLPLLEENTFFSEKRGLCMHYFTKDEILSLVSDFKIIHCSEGRELDLSHGEPHYHGFIEIMGQKR